MAQILRKENSNGGIVVVWKIEESADTLLNSLNLREEEVLKVESYKLETRKLEFLATRRLIKDVIQKDPIIDYLESGKPVLKNSEYKISISHTKGFVAVAFSKGKFAGIDIEYPSDRVARIYKRFVSKKEEKFIAENKKVEYYSLMWCLKESMYKMYDRKSSIFNVNFICHPFELKQEGKITATFDFEDCRTMEFEYLATEVFYLVYHC